MRYLSIRKEKRACQEKGRNPSRRAKGAMSNIARHSIGFYRHIFSQFTTSNTLFFELLFGNRATYLFETNAWFIEAGSEWAIGG
ncbi:MAG: hypothetical protein JWM99_90 [Verrucomicrobiales bacterium]|nr:hypothetical protein [Verrucomicrobiales bacterium]